MKNLSLLIEQWQIFFSEIILELFPNAKIINCKRDPFHNFVAIYQQCLNNLPWAHDVENIKKYISIYNKKLKHLEKNYNKNILNVELEKLTEHPEDTSKEIMSFCKLNWSEKFLNIMREKTNMYHSKQYSNQRKNI